VTYRNVCKAKVWRFGASAGLINGKRRSGGGALEIDLAHRRQVRARFRKPSVNAVHFRCLPMDHGVNEERKKPLIAAVAPMVAELRLVK
jgi:hypothetical protein